MISSKHRPLPLIVVDLVRIKTRSNHCTCPVVPLGEAELVPFVPSAQPRRDGVVFSEWVRE